MKKIKFYIIVLFILTNFFSIDSEEHPFKFELEKVVGNNFVLKISFPDRYGVQKNVPNKILFSATGGLKLVSSDGTFSGKTNPKKSEYFLNLDDFELILTGKGTLEISLDIYYCDHNKNICKKEKIIKKIDV